MKTLDATFAALADPTRRAILARLSKGEATVSELSKPFGLRQPTISKHLRVLEDAGLIRQAKDATVVDSSALDIDEVVESIAALVRRVENPP